jgi:hypothetical protein
MPATTTEPSFQRSMGKSEPILHIMKYFSTSEMTIVKNIVGMGIDGRLYAEG